MGTFIAAYTIVWLILALYLVRLRAGQRGLEQLARTLESQVRDMRVRAEAGSRVDPGA
jgi:CcmD family protein